VPRSTRRPAPARALAAPLLIALLTAGLTACGDDTGGDDGVDGAGLESLTVEGEVGSSPEVTFDGQVSVSKTETETLVEGEGEEVEEGDQVLTHLWIGNGFSQREALDTYKDKKPELLTVDDSVSKVFQTAMEGQAIGSRVLVAAPADDAFGEAGNPALGIANKDTVVFVIDLVSDVLDAPEGTDKDAPDWTPAIVEEDDLPTGFDFEGTPEPADRLRIAPLVQGDGAQVEKGQTIVVDYLGQVYDGKAPFDASYSRGEPTSFQIGTGKVIKGWDQALVGRAVGSRVLLSIPPDLGYGAEGNKDAGIKGTDTLYFVIDILAAG